MRRLQLAPLLVVTIMLAAACSSPPASVGQSKGAGSQFRIATESNRSPFVAATGGIFEASVNQDGSACTWLDQGVDRAAVVWPAGYTAGGSPLRLRFSKVGRRHYRPAGSCRRGEASGLALGWNRMRHVSERLDRL